MTSLVKAIQERLAKICEELGHGEYAYAVDQCVVAIRNADLSDLEPKGVDFLVLTPALASKLASEAADTIAALTARLEAAEGERDELEKQAKKFNLDCQDAQSRAFKAERDAVRFNFCVIHHFPRNSFNPPTGKTYWYIPGYDENLDCMTAIQAIDDAMKMQERK